MDHSGSGRFAAALALALSAAFGAAPAAANAAEPEPSYAPVDAPGPALTVPVGDLRRALECTGDLKGAKQTPVLLVPGTGLTPQEQYGWNYLRQFQAAGRPFCALTTPRFALEVPFFLSPLDGAGGGRVANVALQDLCPVHVADHVKAVTYDAVGYALALDALTHDGPADPSRIDRAVCLQEFPPGVDPPDGLRGFAGVYAVAAPRLATERGPDREPALRCYVTGPCARD